MTKPICESCREVAAGVCEAESKWAEGWLVHPTTQPGTAAWSEFYGERAAAIRCVAAIRALPVRADGRELLREASTLLWSVPPNVSFAGKAHALSDRIDALLSAPAGGVAIEETWESQGDWQCRDYGDGWITFPDRKAAEEYQSQTGAMMRYRRFYAAPKEKQ